MGSAVHGPATMWFRATGKAEDRKREFPKCCLELIMLLRLSFLTCEKNVGLDQHSPAQPQMQVIVATLKR